MVATRSCLNLSKLIHHNYASASLKNGDCIFIDFMVMIYGTVKSFEYMCEIQRDVGLRNVNYIGILAHMDGLSIDKSSRNGRTWHLNVALRLNRSHCRYIIGCTIDILSYWTS